jgi:hypothetical protein
MVRCAVALLALLGWAMAAAAQIYEWRDADGARHFTTDVEDLPPGQRENPRVVVRQSAWGSGEAPPATTEPRRQAQVVYDRRRFRRVEERPAGNAGGVSIHGPLAVAAVEVAQPSVTYQSPLVAVPLYDGPLVTTSFDRGRSRHQTLRMLLQDQFQVDRDGPFVYDRLAASGPRFRSVLRRGLPRRGVQAGCVVSR